MDLEALFTENTVVELRVTLGFPIFNRELFMF